VGRQVRMVPADWQHPKAFNTFRQSMEYVPLYDGGRRSYEREAAEWETGWQKWQEGFVQGYGDQAPWTPRTPEDGDRYTDYAGARPSPDDYMPNWPEEQRTHLMMYEDTTEGTPISPAFETPEELARWLADNGASAFASDTATYDQWLAMARRGWAPSMIVADGKIMSGVEAA
jgi:hypothetical protein